MSETELYEPVKALFINEGFTVRAEVKNCDITAIKDDELVVIELKKNLSIKLLTQAIDRQKFANYVYIAVLRNKKSTFKQTIPLLQKLGLGLIVVDIIKKTKKATIYLLPSKLNSIKEKPNKRISKKRNSIMTEAQLRTVDANTGGTNRKQIMTAYRETSIQLACYLLYNGHSSAKMIKKAGIESTKSYTILYNNHYNWFKRESRGIYSVTDKGIAALEEYPEIAKFYRGLYDKNS